MDSVTQLALGAAVGEATLGRKIGNRAIWWGGIAGTIPDLDIFIPFSDPVNSFISHRSFSHSLFTLALLTPFLVWLIRRIHPDTREHNSRWYVLVYLAFATHVLLDSFTAYGTQIFWPIIHQPIMWSTIFIVDPLYTLPLIGGVLCALILSRAKGLGHTANNIGLVLSTLYLSWTVVAKVHVENFATEQLASQQITYTHLLVQPTPINSLLWRIVIMQDGAYAEGFYSLLDRRSNIRLKQYTSAVHLLDALHAFEPIQGLRWFTQGFWGIKQQQDHIVISDLRMGLEPNYVFSFVVGQKTGTRIVPIPSERQSSHMNWGHVLPQIWKRIWNPSVTTLTETK